MAINDAHRLAPWADVLYAADAKWWAYHRGVPTFPRAKYSLQAGAAQWGVTVLQNTGDTGLEQDPRGLRTGRNSGYQAINLAVHYGAARVLLLGYDMQAASPQTSHWFGQHPAPLRSHSPYDTFRQRFTTLVAPLEALGIEVINCTLASALTVFPIRPLREVLR